MRGLSLTMAVALLTPLVASAEVTQSTSVLTATTTVQMTTQQIMRATSDGVRGETLINVVLNQSADLVALERVSDGLRKHWAVQTDSEIPLFKDMDTGYSIVTLFVGPFDMKRGGQLRLHAVRNLPKKLQGEVEEADNEFDFHFKLVSEDGIWRAYHTNAQGGESSAFNEVFFKATYDSILGRPAKPVGVENIRYRWHRIGTEPDAQ